MSLGEVGNKPETANYFLNSGYQYTMLYYWIFMTFLYKFSHIKSQLYDNIRYEN